MGDPPKDQSVSKAADRSHSSTAKKKKSEASSTSKVRSTSEKKVSIWEQVEDAFKTLKSRQGLSRTKIAGFITEKYKQKDAAFNSRLRRTLKVATDDNRLVQDKQTFRLAPVTKSPQKARKSTQPKATTEKKAKPPSASEGEKLRGPKTPTTSASKARPKAKVEAKAEGKGEAKVRKTDEIDKKAKAKAKKQKVANK